MKLGYKFIVTGQQNLIAFNVRCLPSTKQHWVLFPYVRYQICCNKIREGSNTKLFSCEHSPILRIHITHCERVTSKAIGEGNRGAKGARAPPPPPALRGGGHKGAQGGTITACAR